MDSSGTLWVADTGNSRVLRFDYAASKANGAPADGVLGKPDFYNRGIAASRSGTDGPFGVAIDSNGTLWVADTGNGRVLRFDHAASKANGAPADAVLGTSSFAGGGGGYVNQSSMYFPVSVAIDSRGTLWVADTYNSRVLRFDHAVSKANGAPADGVLGEPDFTSRRSAISQSTMDQPIGLAVDSSGGLWVADTNNNRVLRFLLPIAAAKTSATATIISANTGPATATIAPTSIPTRTPTGPSASLVLGQPDFASSGNGINASAMHHPYSVAIDPTTSQVFVADYNNSRVLRFASFSNLRNGVAAVGVLGQPDFISYTTAHNQSGMNTPQGIAVDGSGTLWVADTDNNRVLRFDHAASKPNGANADGVLGQPDFTTWAWAISQSGMSAPVAITVDSNGILWTADGSNRILRFDHAASKPNGANADGVLGQPDFISNTAAATQSGMNSPSGIMVDSSGTLWVADSYNSRVLRFDRADSKANSAPADGVLGQPDFTSDTTATTQYGMWYPSDIAMDDRRRLWVVDSANNRLLRFDRADSKANGASADGVLGQSDFTSGTSAVTQFGMNRPGSVAVDNTEGLWVVDSENNRVLRFPNTSAASSAPSQ